MKLTVTFTDNRMPLILNDVKQFIPEEETMNFAEAVKALQMGNAVRRLSWPKKRLRVLNERMVIYDENRKWDWMATIEDFAAEDWFLVAD